MRRDIFQVITDPARRAIIALNVLQVMAPNALAAHFDITRQAVSKHLHLLLGTRTDHAGAEGQRDLLSASDQ